MQSHFLGFYLLGPQPHPRFGPQAVSGNVCEQVNESSRYTGTRLIRREAPPPHNQHRKDLSRDLGEAGFALRPGAGRPW